MRAFSAAALSVLTLSIRLGAQPAAIPPDSLFRFHSGFWINLHHTLYMQARASVGLDSGTVERQRAESDSAGFSALAEIDRVSWVAARRYYATRLARRNPTFDTLLIRVTRVLAEHGSNKSLPGFAPESLAIVLNNVAPIYERLWWPRHDRANRAWERAVTPLVGAHGPALVSGASRFLGPRWLARPIRVELSYHTKTNGAYTPDRGLGIVMTTSDTAYQNTGSLEMLFHEAFHTAEDSVDVAAAEAARQAGADVPYDVNHAFIFTAAGELLRARVPGYVPYVQRVGLIDGQRGVGPYLRRMSSEWAAFEQGRLTLREMLRLATPGSPP